MWFPGLHRAIAWRLGRLVDRDRYEEANTLAAWYARHRPGDPMAWLMLADARLKGNMFSGREDPDSSGLEAEEAILRQGAILHPDSVDLGAALARNLGFQRRSEEAESMWTDLRERFPDSPLPYEGLANDAIRYGDHERCREMVNEALRRAPDPESLGRLGVDLLWVPGEEARALDLLSRSAEASRNPFMHAILFVLLEREDSRAAARHLAEARRLRGQTTTDEEVKQVREIFRANPLPGARGLGN